MEYAELLKPMMADVAATLHDLRKHGKDIMFEGAQGSLLDIDHGTYPYVTSSNTTAGGTATGSGFGPLYWTTYWVSPRPIPLASAPVRSRPSCSTTSAPTWPSAATSSAPPPVALVAAAGSMP